MFLYKYILFCAHIVICFAANVKRFDNTEGSHCISESLFSSYNGTCVRFNRCIGALRQLKRGERPKICSFDKENPIVCCTDCELDVDPSNIVFNKYGKLFYKTGKKTYDKCLEYSATLPYACSIFVKRGLDITWKYDLQCHAYEKPTVFPSVGGYDANRKEYPHMALLGYGPELETVKWLCGGSVVSEKFILTAAHCKYSLMGPVSYVALGILKRTDPEEYWQRYKVKRFIPHPEYKSPSKYHDIALLETEERIKFSASVLPGCLDPGDARISYAYATGWGALGFNQRLADTLQTVYLKEFSKEECAKQYPVHRLLQKGYDHSSQMCFGDDAQVKDTCMGDSGGPLQVTSYWGYCMHMVIGVTSYGRNCGFVGNAGIYTRVSHYIPWIESVVWP